MPNPYFIFKQFIVFHDRCGMKVGTDGVLLGAWTNIGKSKKGLDIGTGSGLISLMLAQRNNNLSIDAIDIDDDAILQSKENISKSPFREQISCYRKSFSEFASTCRLKYDLIVSNPPYFEKSLKSPAEKRYRARHSDNLSFKELIGLSAELLLPEGCLSLIYPFEYKQDLYEQDMLYINRMTNVYPTPKSNPKRILVELSRKEISFEEDDLIIENERHKYSDDFLALVKDYYLNL